MTHRIRFTDPSAPDFPTVVADDLSVHVQWDGVAFRCSADTAHILADLLFQAALLVERRLMELEGPPPDSD